MAKPERQPRPRSDADDDDEGDDIAAHIDAVAGDDADDEDGQESGEGFDKILALLTGQDQPKRAGADPTTMMMMMMMQQQREARAEKNSFMKLAISLLPMLFKKETDPLMLEVIRASMSGKNQEEFTRSMMTIQQHQAESNMNMLKNTLESTSRLKDEMVTSQLDDMRERLNQNNQPASSPWIEAIREVKSIIEPVLERRLNGNTHNQTQGTGPVAVAAGGAGSHTTLPAPKIDPVGIAVRTLKILHERQATMSPQDRRAMISKLSIVIMEVPELVDAIIDQDEPALSTLCKPVVMSDPAIMQWIVQDGVAAWVAEFLTKKVAPILDSMCAVEDADNGDDAEDDVDAGAEVSTAPVANISVVQPHGNGARKPAGMKPGPRVVNGPGSVTASPEVSKVRTAVGSVTDKPE